MGFIMIKCWSSLEFDSFSRQEFTTLDRPQICVQWVTCS